MGQAKASQAPWAIARWGNLGERTGNFLLASFRTKKAAWPIRTGCIHSLGLVARSACIRSEDLLSHPKLRGDCCTWASSASGRNFAERTACRSDGGGHSRRRCWREERGRKRRALRTEIKAARTSLARLIGQARLVSAAAQDSNSIGSGEILYFRLPLRIRSSPDDPFL